MYPATNNGSYEDVFVAPRREVVARGHHEDAFHGGGFHRGGYTSGSDQSLPLSYGTKQRAAVGSGNQKCSLFPMAFTLFCVTTFFIPIWLLSTYIGRDMNAEYFFGKSATHTVLFLPCLYLAVHAIHVCIGHPSRSLILGCLFGSGLMLLVSGSQVLKASRRNAEGLVSSDCGSLHAKRELERQWQAARTFYATCILATAAETNTSFTDDVQKFRIHDCGGYDVQLLLNPAWSYLEKLEERQRCAGWCSKSQALWTLDPVKESCTVAVAEVMSKKHARAAMQVVTYSLFVLFFVAIGAALGAPALKDWFGN